MFDLTEIFDFLKKFCKKKQNLYVLNFKTTKQENHFLFFFCYKIYSSLEENSPQNKNNCQKKALKVMVVRPNYVYSNK